MNYNRKTLENLYSQVAGKPVAQRKHLNVLEEEPEQQQLLRGLRGGINKGKEVAVSAKDQATGKYDVESNVNITLTDDDLENFKLLDSIDKQRVKKYIESKAFRKLTQNTLRGSEKEVEQAFNLLMSSHLTGDDIHKVMQDINTGKAVNTKLLTQVGNYSIEQIFSSDEAWEVFKILSPVGVGKKQQGPGEVAFAMMSPDVDEQTKGDISINGELYELKLNGGRISDKPGPAGMKIRNILSNYFSEQDMDHFNSQQSLNTSSFVMWVNNAKRAGSEADFVKCAQEIYSLILDPQFAQPLSAMFKADQIDPKSVISMFTRQSFDWYKNTKTGTDGAWSKLIGINTEEKNGSISVVETGDQFAKTPMKSNNPAIVRTGAGTRENYIEFYPVK